MHHSSFDYPTGYQPSLDHSPYRTYLPQQSNLSLTVQDLPIGDTTDMGKPVDDDDDMILIDNATNQPLQVNVVNTHFMMMYVAAALNNIREFLMYCFNPR